IEAEIIPARGEVVPIGQGAFSREHRPHRRAANEDVAVGLERVVEANQRGGRPGRRRHGPTASGRSRAFWCDTGVNAIMRCTGLYISIPSSSNRRFMRRLNSRCTLQRPESVQTIWPAMVTPPPLILSTPQSCRSLSIFIAKSESWRIAAAM